MFCRMCGEQIPDNSETCPVCGEEQHIITTGETEKGGGTDKTLIKVLKGAGKVVAKVGGSILMAASSVVVAAVSDEVGKGVQKKLKKGVSTVMKATGMKNKTLLDKAGDAAKAWQKKRRK